MTNPSQSHAFFIELSQDLNLPLDIVKTVFCLLLNIPLSGLFPLLKSSLLRQGYALIVGLCQLLFLLEYQAVYIIGIAVLTLLCVQIVRVASFATSCVCSAVSLLVVHLHRFIFDYSSWKVDCSVYVMILVTKLTYYGLDLQNSKKMGLIQRGKARHSVLCYFAYCFFFPSLLVGPTFSFERFLDFVHCRKEYQNAKISLQGVIRPFLLGLLTAAVTVLTLSTFDYKWVLRNQDYLNLPLPLKLLAINAVGVFYRVKFYAAWYLAQTAINISCLSYSQNGRNQAVTCGSILFQIEPNPKNKTQYWNSSIQTWLKVVVYENVLKSSRNQTVATLFTFLVSAFWHGIYLTYYVGFIQWGFLSHLTKWVYKMCLNLPQKLRESFLSAILVYLCGSIAMNYIGLGIVLLQWQNMVHFYSDLRYCVSIVMGIMFALSFLVKPPKARKENKGSLSVAKGKEEKNL